MTDEKTGEQKFKGRKQQAAGTLELGRLGNEGGNKSKNSGLNSTRNYGLPQLHLRVPML